MKNFNLSKKDIQNLEMSGPSIGKTEINYVLDAVKNGWYGKDKFYYVEKFEQDFAKYHNRKFGLMTPNCTVALHLILHALGIGKGDNVINQECTWVASAAAVKYVGAENIFADISYENWCMDETSLIRRINKKTKAVIVSDVYGNLPNMEKIIKICKQNNIFLIEDSAEALGSVYKGKKAGSFGIASAFSFHRTKTLTTGEGGMIVTDNKKFYERCKFLRDQGRNKKQSYLIDELGFKFMPFNLQASLGLAQLNRLKSIIDKKRWIFKKYKSFFSDIKDIQFNKDDQHLYNGCWATTIVIGKRYKTNAKKLMKNINNKGLPVRPFFAPIGSMKPFYYSKSKKGNLNSYDIFSRGLTLPSALNLNENQLYYYSSIIKNILKNG